MKEIIDSKDNVKMMALIISGIVYDNHKYLLYSISRGHDEGNVFVSRLVLSSNGYKIDHEFKNGEKEGIEVVIKRMFSKENVISLENDGYQFIRNIELDGVNYFDSDVCYVATFSKQLIKDCAIFYRLIDEEEFRKPVISVEDDKRIFNEGFVGNVFVIIIGICILIFSISILIFYFNR